jgi:hypothetical protein
VLATAAEAIRIITALVYPIVPDAAAKVWRQLGQGEIADAAKQAFLTNVAWGGVKAGTKFGEPAPLFPRAEKDAVERMQNLEDENNRTAVEAAKGETVAPGPATASPSVTSMCSLRPLPVQEPRVRRRRRRTFTPFQPSWPAVGSAPRLWMRRLVRRCTPRSNSRTLRRRQRNRRR